MANAIERILANNLADFEGLKMEGTIVISEELINVFVSDYLKTLATPATTDDPASTAPTFDLPALLQALQIDQAAIELHDKKLNIQLKIRR